MTGPQRIQRQRVKGWRMPEGAVYVGRPTQWGNPWTVGEPIGIEWADTAVGEGSRFFRELPITAELAVALYRIAFTPDAEDIRAELGGRDLACWCPYDQPCHADVLLEIANSKPTALERIQPLVDAGGINACTRSFKPMTEGDAQALLDFHELLANQPTKEKNHGTDPRP